MRFNPGDRVRIIAVNEDWTPGGDGGDPADIGRVGVVVVIWGGGAFRVEVHLDDAPDNEDYAANEEELEHE